MLTSVFLFIRRSDLLLGYCTSKTISKPASIYNATPTTCTAFAFPQPIRGDPCRLLHRLEDTPGRNLRASIPSNPVCEIRIAPMPHPLFPLLLLLLLLLLPRPNSDSVLTPTTLRATYSSGFHAAQTTPAQYRPLAPAIVSFFAAVVLSSTSFLVVADAGDSVLRKRQAEVPRVVPRWIGHGSGIGVLFCQIGEDGNTRGSRRLRARVVGWAMSDPCRIAPRDNPPLGY
ncbi:hypothetical protein R3P38DRAFT_3185557 [Favolaschia claudopus]|uniref:Uncharacterized protein n=1 Tax=Favolaschia claudopus TaxID=2862362 RepID=A0AAW0C7V1_9AGAR